MLVGAPLTFDAHYVGDLIRWSEFVPLYLYTRNAVTGSRSVGFCAVVSITPRMVVFRFVVRSGRPSA